MHDLLKVFKEIQNQLVCVLFLSASWIKNNLRKLQYINLKLLNNCLELENFKIVDYCSFIQYSCQKINTTTFKELIYQQKFFFQVSHFSIYSNNRGSSSDNTEVEKPNKSWRR